MSELKKSGFDGVYFIGSTLAVKNMLPGYNPFSDDVFRLGSAEYIEWNPNRSKLAAAIVRGIESIHIKTDGKMLYLGCAHGYTTFHIANIITSGIIYGIEFSERCFNELLPICKRYENIIPILADARKTEEYAWIEKVDIVFCDIAQPDEIEIFIRSCREFLKEEGYGMIAVKSRSIDVTKTPTEVYKEALKKLEHADFDIVDWKTLDPYERAHCFIVVKFKH